MEFLSNWTVQLILAVIIVISILLQPGDKGLDGAFGGSGLSGESVGHTRRGAELLFFWTTIIAGILLLISIVLGMF